MSEEPNETLREDIARIINRRSRENVSNTPDFILASFLHDCIVAFEIRVRDRDKWYGILPRPGQFATPPPCERCKKLEAAVRVARDYTSFMDDYDKGIVDIACCVLSEGEAKPCG
jgi:hypothetical protein